MAADQTKWRIELSGRETIENRRIERTGNKEVKVYGTAYLDFSVSVEITLPQKYTPNKKFYGRIFNPKVTGYDASYRPSNVYRIKKKILSANFVNNLSGRSIIGFMPDPEMLQLNWPMPFAFKEPAVIVITDDLVKPGADAEACFSADRFFDYVSSYKLELKNGWTKDWNHPYSGAMDRAEVEYSFRLTTIP